MDVRSVVKGGKRQEKKSRRRTAKSSGEGRNGIRGGADIIAPIVGEFKDGVIEEIIGQEFSTFRITNEILLRKQDRNKTRYG